MTQLEALKVAYEELSSMMPDGENDEIFEAAEVKKKWYTQKKDRLKKASLNMHLWAEPIGNISVK